MISIVTVCLNAKDGIDKTLNSIESQTNENYEHILKDGISTDSTLELIQALKTERTKIFSYADVGVYNAFNQSLEHCVGDYVNFLGAGDRYYNKNILDIVESEIRRTNCDLLFGDINIIKSVGDRQFLHRKWRSGKFEGWKLRWGWMPPHPSVFARKSLFKTVGKFNEKFSISGDYDWLLRALKSDNLKVHYLELPLVNMEYGGVSQTNRKTSFVEDSLIGFKHGYVALPILKRLAKVNQFTIKGRRLL